MKTIQEEAKEVGKYMNESWHLGYENAAGKYKTVLQEILNLYHSFPSKDTIDNLYHKVKKLLA